MKSLKFSNLSAHMRYNMAALVAILSVFLVITLLQAYFTWRSINDERLNRERMEVNVNNERIDLLKEKTQDILMNSVAAFEQQLDSAEYVEPLLVAIMRQNDELLGVALAYKPNYLKKQKGLYAPYVFRKDGNIRKTLVSYDYTQHEWYSKAMKSGRAEWSEPYTSNYVNTSMVTFSVPLKNKSGRQVAVLSGDLAMSDLAYVTDSLYHKSSLRSIVVLFMQMVGLLLIIVISWRAIVSMRRFKNVSNENKQIADELSIATNLQSQILPREYPVYKGLEIRASLVPGAQVSGDFYDFVLQDDKLLFCIGDVATHGIGACIALAVTRTACRSSMMARQEPLTNMMNYMNQTLVGINKNEMFATLFICQLDLLTGTLLYCNAGHPAPYMLTGKTIVALDAKPNVPLGITEWDYEEQQVQLESGDTIFLYTEGITEALNGQNVPFGRKKLALHLKNASENADSPEALLKRIDTAMRYHLGTEGKAEDDLTMMAVRYNLVK